MRSSTLALFVLMISILPVFAWAKPEILVGSKIFTESYILGEVASQIVEKSSSVPVVRKLGLGSTGVLVDSLKTEAIDVYPDYTGTVAETILKNPQLKSVDEIREALKGLGLTISDSLGFNNTYALAVTAAFAEKNNLGTITDLAKISSRVSAAFSYEFMKRADGYQGLAERYQLNFAPDRLSEMEHSLVYRAVADGKVDVIEIYSTDANIDKFHLKVLKDDLNYFPLYQAVWVARSDFVNEHPREWQALKKLEGRIDEKAMRSMNASADIDKQKIDFIAASYLGEKRAASAGILSQVSQRTKEHLFLVLISLVFSVLIGVPLGIAAARFRAAEQVILLSSAIIQTIPALALLCFLIPLFGIGVRPALVALCLYTLLPVVLNTYTGIKNVESRHVENARAFGLNAKQALVHIVLPLASPMILAGLKTATIVSIGTATLAALIGAGGYGALIVSGLSLNDIPTVLSGAIPAALMALFAHFGFEFLSRQIIPKGLQEKRS